MSKLRGRIDFVVLAGVTLANPNGDPLNGNRPRVDNDGYGMISDVCIKRKIRDRIQDMGTPIFVQSEHRSNDGYRSLKERAANTLDLDKGKEAIIREAEEKYFDIRAFGQLFAFKGTELSVGIRGPVTIHQALSVSPVEIVSMQITKSVNSEDVKDGKKASDTMGLKHMVRFGLYVIKGSVSAQLAEKTGFSQEDAENLKEALRTLFENDASAARPDGSMEICQMYWWQHEAATPSVSVAAVHKSVRVTPLTDIPLRFEDYEVVYTPVGDVKAEIF